MKKGDFVSRISFLDRLIYSWMHSYPLCCIWGVLELSGPPDNELLIKSAGLVIEAVPALNSRMDNGVLSKKWIYCGDFNPAALVSRLEAEDSRDAETLLNRILKNPIPVDDPPLFRVVSINSPEKNFLVLQVHHYVMDGKGAKTMFALFADTYRNLSADPGYRPERLNSDRSWMQFIKHVNPVKRLLAPLFNMKEFAGFIYFFLTYKKYVNVITGDRKSAPRSNEPADPCFAALYINDRELDLIRGENIKKGVKLNDRIMAALMVTLKKWNDPEGRKYSGVNSCYTADIRRWWGEPEGTFSNMSIVRMLSIPSGCLDNMEDALACVKRKMDRAKREFGLAELWYMVLMGINPVFFSEVVCRFLKKFILRINVLTNIGIIEDNAGNFGKIRALKYSLIAPPFAAPNILFTATGYRNSLTINCNFEPSYMSRHTCERLIERFRKNLLTR